jgi:trans-aconitate 2-methyltransferase
MSDESTQSWDPKLYQSAHAFVWQKAADLLELLNPQPGERIIDLGCGTGQLTNEIAKRGATVVGIDCSAQMIAQAQKNFPNLRLQISDATSFSVDHPVDAVFSNATLHWVKPPAAAAKRVFAALGPGGRFVAEFGGKGNVRHICEAIRVALRERLGWDFERIDPWYYPSVGEYASLLESVGFGVTFATLFDRPTPLEGEDGMKNWLRMFGASILDKLPHDRREDLLAAVESHVRPHLLKDGKWFADYVRLRVVARKPNAAGSAAT